MAHKIPKARDPGRVKGHNRATKIETEARVQTLIELQAQCWSREQLVKFCMEEWGYAPTGMYRLLERVSREIKARWMQDREEFIAERLNQLENIARKAVESDQHSAAVGAQALMGKFTRTTT